MFVETEREWIEDCLEGVRVRPENFRADEGGPPIEPSIRFTAFVTTDAVGPLALTLLVSVFAGSEVSAGFFPPPSFGPSDKAEGGRITKGVLKTGASRLWGAGAGVLPAVPRTPILRFS